jgi:arylsulfatase A-like enzyme
MKPSLALLFVLFLSVPLSADEAKPNVIYIMADDLGYGDLGCYGQEVIQTPHIDRLAAEGMKFTDHYAGHTVCRPSRLVLLTGKHVGNLPIHDNVPYDLPAGAVTVTSLLQEAGYVTGGVGKWALGGPGSDGSPVKQGFDFWFGYLDQGDAHNYYPEYLYRNEEKVPLPGNKVGDQRRVSVKRVTYAHDEMTREALEFIRENRDRPFFLQAHYTIPHANNEGGRATGDGMEVPDYGIYADRDWPSTEKGFAAMITRLDGDVGKMIALLKELGLDERTLVIFTSDNGPHQEGGHKVDFFHSRGPIRGYKRDLYEGGIRVPMIARWPGRIAPGSVTAHPSAFWDVLPTLCELAGAEPPEDIDGISFLPVLLGKEQPEHDYLYWRMRGKIGLRQGNWKLVRTDEDAPFELYDLDNDLGEQNNLAGQHPGIVTRMQRIVEKYAD